MPTACRLLLGLLLGMAGALAGAEASVRPVVRRGLRSFESRHHHHQLRGLRSSNDSSPSPIAKSEHTYLGPLKKSRMDPQLWDRYLAGLVQKWSGLEQPEEECPEWISGYAQKHAQMLKESQEDPHYLMYLCQPSLFFNQTQNCSGTGDRIKAMEFTFQLAAAAQRPLLISWEHPLPLETFFQPAGSIDWRVKKQLNLPDIMSDDTARYVWNSHLHGSLYHDISSNAYLSAEESLIAVSTNSQGEDMPGLPLGGRMSRARSCIFNALFKPSEELEQRVEQARTELFGDAITDYLAIHLRLGGLEGEDRQVERFDPLKGLLSALEASQLLAEANNITSPVLLLTDNAQLREIVASGLLGPTVVGPTALARHIASSRTKNTTYEEELEMHMPTFVEVALLAQSKCLIYSHSGFSMTAVEWGWPSCRVDVDTLIKSFEQKPFEAVAHHKAHHRVHKVD